MPVRDIAMDAMMSNAASVDVLHHEGFGCTLQIKGLFVAVSWQMIEGWTGPRDIVR